MQEKLISVIIPVYNVELYLNRCIESVLSQTFTDFELILVDDGSPDNSPKMCDEIAQKDSRVVVVHKKNGGLSSARNAGLDIAKGEYVFFIDSDDWLSDKNVLEKFYNVATKYNSDFIYGLLNSSDGQKVNNIRFVSKFSDEKLVLLSNPHFFSAWNKLFKRELINNFRFTEGIVNEDVDMIPLVLQKANQVKCLKEFTYCYFFNPNSITRKAFSDKRFDIFKAVTHIYKDFVGSEDEIDVLYQNLFGFQIYAVYITILLSKNKIKNLRKFIYFLKDAQYKDFFNYCTKCFVNFDSKIKCIIKIMLLWLLRVLCWIF